MEEFHANALRRTVPVPRVPGAGLRLRRTDTGTVTNLYSVPHLHPLPNADLSTHGDALPHLYPYSGPNCHTQPDVYSSTNRDPGSDPYANTHVRANTHSRADGHTNGNIQANADADDRSNSNTDRNTSANFHAQSRSAPRADGPAGPDVALAKSEANVGDSLPGRQGHEREALPERT